jgi:hypothetical protein
MVLRNISKCLKILLIRKNKDLSHLNGVKSSFITENYFIFH